MSKDPDERGDQERIAQFNGRTFERTQGCWNCKHSSSGTKRWTDKREAMLSKALEAAVNEGEDSPRCVTIRTAINQIDHDVASKRLLVCGNKLARTADGNDVGNLVANSFLCGQWSAAQGASIARAGQRADDLPEELQDKIDGSSPKTIADILGGQEVN